MSDATENALIVSPLEGLVLSIIVLFLGFWLTRRFRFLADNFIRTLSPLYVVLPAFRSFRTRLTFPRGVPMILASLCGLHLLSALAFLMPHYYISSRHVVAASLTLLLTIPFVLASVHDRWIQRGHGGRFRRWRNDVGGGCGLWRRLALRFGKQITAALDDGARRDIT